MDIPRCKNTPNIRYWPRDELLQCRSQGLLLKLVRSIHLLFRSAFYMLPAETCLKNVRSCIMQTLEMLAYILFQFHLTSESDQPPYPEWAQFIGALVVLSSVMMIPLFLIVRLIGYQQARDEGMEFITRQKESFRDFTKSIKRLIKTR